MTFLRPTITLLGAMLWAAAGSVHADTVTVTQLDDFVDFGGGQTIADLPGPDGLVAFREAVIAVNKTPGAHRIEFAIPPGQPLGDLLRIDGPPFRVTRDGTIVDFLSQAIFLGDPDPDGPGLGILNTSPSSAGQPALVIAASDCEVRGLGFTQFRESIRIVSGQDNRIVRNFTNSIVVQPNFGGVVTGTVIGGAGPDDGNEAERISLGCGANDSIVIGNRVEAIDVTGSPFCGDGVERPTGNRIGGPTPGERNIVSGFGTYNGEGRPSGTGILVDFASGTIVEGNFVGVNEDGTAQADDQNRGTTGIEIRDSVDTVVRGNLVSGIRGIGISEFAGQVFGRAILVNALNDDVSGVVIEGNLVGVDVTGETAIPTHAGIEVIPGTISRSIIDVRIGGADAAAGNVIAFTEGDGVTVAGGDVSGVEITRNRIHDNAGLGVDLRTPTGSAGVTPNDPGDGDAGPNGFQNFPVVSVASFDGDTATVAGELSSMPDRSYRIELFASPQADPSGHGEGRIFLGEAHVATNANGQASFDLVVPAASAGISEGWVATATATDVQRGETSEFGPALAFEFDPACPADLDDTGTVDAADLFDLLGAWGSCPGCAEDLTGDETVDADDLFELLAAWGSC